MYNVLGCVYNLFPTLIGFHCDQHENAADFFLDVIIQCEHTGGTAATAAATFGMYAQCLYMYMYLYGS